MVTEKERGITFSIIKHCKRIEAVIKEITKPEFVKNEDLKEIVCFNLLQIEELAKTLSPKYLAKKYGLLLSEVSIGSRRL